MVWNLIDTQGDINTFMNQINFFHDGCIKEIKYISGSYVDKNLSIFPINNKRNLYVIIQRQCNKLSTIELLFQGICKMNLTPHNEEYDCVIHKASMEKINDMYYWADWDGFKISDIGKIDGTLIIASKISWRILDSSLGKNEIYITQV